ncbi:MAG: shikimate dehydrogenase [Myxococcota bacterium]
MSHNADPAKQKTTTAAYACGIVLHPAGHTRSPAMHRAAYAALGIEATYTAHDIPPAELKAAMTRFREEAIRQLAVSIPHKEEMLSQVDEIEPVAQTIGAINTVTRVGERLIGTNTDWIGALRALERETEVKGQRAVVLGAGGTARALVYGLKQRGCEVFVLNRTQARAETLVRDLSAEGAGPLEQLAALRPALLINTTSVGLNEAVSPVASEAIPEGATVLDAVYSPERTRFLVEAEARGARPVGGKWMLIYQALEQLRIWTSALPEPPSDADLDAVIPVMEEAFDQAG